MFAAGKEGKWSGYAKKNQASHLVFLDEVVEYQYGQTLWPWKRRPARGAKQNGSMIKNGSEKKMVLAEKIREQGMVTYGGQKNSFIVFRDMAVYTDTSQFCVGWYVSQHL